ncbi:MAG: CoA activase, partial [Deltaproteobacteria bacterium]|nr:CoA activase [Deltaproteobacteria bacterium]
EEFGDLALSAKQPVQLGERCTVFMESDLIHHQQQGAETPDLVAGLSYSIATNYLNKVVEDRRVGDHIFYQGATAFNKGIVAAFENITGKKITVPDHTDVTGAIGSAILAMRERTWEKSNFKGFDLSERRYEITSFECNGCSNACEIRKVTLEGEAPLFYGSRCEKYDVKKKEAAESGIPDLFTERAELLFNPPEAVRPEGLDRGVIGVPRAMFFHEVMPFFKTFLASLGFEVVLSEKSNKKLIHQGVEVVVNEPCFPTKVGHGHILDLIDKGVKRIFLPSAINMPKKDPAMEWSKICPYSQTLTYTCHAAIDFKAHGVELIQGPVYFGEGERILNDCMIKIGKELGAGAREVKKAVRRGLEAQENFYQHLLARGREVMDLLDENGWLGMVVISRPYNGFDPGLNLNLSSKLRDLGVVGIPMDFLPLDDPQYHEEAIHHYWRYAQKILSVAEIIRRDERLYGIFITNFGCGPDSFIQHFLRDIMRGKPYLEIEIDEHSSDVGAVTRLEAFLDSLKNVTVPKESQSLLTFRGRKVQEMKNRKLFIPPMVDHTHAIAAAFEACGVEAEVLPPSDIETLTLGRKLTSGKECYPCCLTTGDMVRLIERPGFDPDRMAFMMPSGNGPCRFGQYHRFHRLVLDELGHDDVPVYATDQGSTMYDELEELAGKEFKRIAWQGIVAVDLITKKRLETRPYEVSPGAVDEAYQMCLDDICETLRNRGDLLQCLVRCRNRQDAVELKGVGSKPIIGVVGEIYTRTNDFSNENTIRNVEYFGGEAWMPSVGEWILYLNQAHMAVLRRKRDWKALLSRKIINYFQVKDMHKLEEVYRNSLRNFHEPLITETFDYASPYLDRSFEGETILSVGKSEDFLRKGASGLINIIPFTCMPGNIVVALLKCFREDHNNVPVLNIACDG